MRAQSRRGAKSLVAIVGYSLPAAVYVDFPMVRVKSLRHKSRRRIGDISVHLQLGCWVWVRICTRGYVRIPEHWAVSSLPISPGTSSSICASKRAAH